MSTAQLADEQHPWIGLAPFTESDREFFAGRGDEFRTGIFGSNRIVQFALNRQIEPLLRTRLHLESHSSSKPKYTQQPDRLVREAVNRQRTHFGALNV